MNNKKEYNKNYQKLNRYKILKQKKLDYHQNKLKYILKEIKQRCNNPNNKRYKDYGLRGIKCLITEEELEFLWFRDKAWLLKEPSIDRKDNDGNYELSNCQFIEMDINRVKDRLKPILQFDLNDKLIKEWLSIKDASQKLKISNGDIVACCKKYKYHKSAGGYKWKYKEE